MCTCFELTHSLTHCVHTVVWCQLLCSSSISEHDLICTKKHAFNCVKILCHCYFNIILLLLLFQSTYRAVVFLHWWYVMEMETLRNLQCDQVPHTCWKMWKVQVSMKRCHRFCLRWNQKKSKWWWCLSWYFRLTVYSWCCNAKGLCLHCVFECQHLFSSIPNEEKEYAAACGRLEKKRCTQCLFSGCYNFIGWARSWKYVKYVKICEISDDVKIISQPQWARWF